ncbi:MAG: sugar-binding domain-containing protein [Prolixibacteraceae bacterium]
MKKWTVLLLVLMGCWGLRAQPVNDPAANRNNVISLAGIWKFKLDPFLDGISSNGVQILSGLPEEITLPGSTDQAGKGYKTQHMTSLRLTRLFEYKGPAWYEKEIYIPGEWKDQEVRLFLERVHWESQVWVNGKFVGRRESLSAPHVYPVSALVRPGQKNVIRIRVNNEMIHNIEYSHAVSAETQTNWNGIIGRIELQAFEKVGVDDVQVYPQSGLQQAEIKIQVRNSTGKAVSGKISFGTDSVAGGELPFSGNDSLFCLSALMPVTDLEPWDEFNPALHRLSVELSAVAGGQQFSSSRTEMIGLRELATQGTRLAINGRPVFIRGTVNCAEFPITGYPPTDTGSWMRILKICRDYGLNAVRFHSWCPPEAAFIAADQLGIYLQIENSDWRFTVGKDSATNRFLQQEADRILETYGNHPSFISLGEGNELVGPTVTSFLGDLVSRWKEKDPRHLYTGSAAYPLVPENQFNVLYGARPQRWKEGLKGLFNVAPLNTTYDYTDYVQKHPVPMISHEVGQWCVYPDFNEIPRYTGVLKPYNYELFRELLRDRHMLDQAQAFMEASGKFQVIQKKEEIESYLRTPGMAGYHLLQLNDFPGQGTSPVGVVDVLWNPKSYVTAAEFSRFQSDRTSLLRTSSFVWTNDQTFKAVAEAVNFGESALQDVVIGWSLRYPDGGLYQEGTFEALDLPVGGPFKTGDLSVSLNRIEQATRLILSMETKEGTFSNHWSIWVYPAEAEKPDLKNVLVTEKWDQQTKRQLEKGGNVMLIADTAHLVSDVAPGFSGISWNVVWSGTPPNLLGILCDPTHPALADFPTEFHSNWQWWDLVANSKPMVLDHMPPALKPLVQMIPDWNNPRRIGLLFEAKVGKGRLLVCGVDLKNKMEQRPVARQFRCSLEKYMTGDAFNPFQEVTMEMIDKLFEK